MKLLEDVPLALYTTFRIGGAARFFMEVESEEELREAVAFAAQEGLPLFALGGGSNVLVPDDGFAGLVVHLTLDGAMVQDGDRIVVPAGVDWDLLVRTLCEEGRCGMECLAGIPGLVGASPIQNIGAYGQEVAQTVAVVRALDRRTGEFVELGREACGFGYRTSVFNTTERGRYLITQVTFALDSAARPNLSYADLRSYFAGREQPTALDVYHAVREIRRRKGMILLPDAADGVEDTRSAGSFFKNPMVAQNLVERIAAALGVAEESVPQYPAGPGQVKLAAAWLLERAGFAKGFQLGRAGISTRHTLALVNRGQATYAEVAALRDRIATTVEARFGVRLEQEPVEPGG